MKPLKTRLLCIALAACWGSTATAAAEPTRDFPQRLYLGGGLGGTLLEPATRDTGYHIDEDHDSGAMLTLGYDLSKRLSIEGFAGSLGAAGIADDQNGQHVGGIDYQVAGASAIGYFYNSRRATDYPGHPDDEGYYRREGLSLYARAGVSKLDTSSDDVVHRQRNDWELHLGGGLEYGWTSGFAARLEFISFDEDAKIVALGLIKRFGRSHSPLPKVVVTPKPLPPTVKMPPPTPDAPPPPAALPSDFPAIHFHFDRADLTPEATRTLDDIAKALKDRPTRVTLSGHTDSIGSDAYNQRLGQRRADSAARYLIRQGIDAGRLDTVSFGETQPVADNATPEGRRLNRRVEFEIEPR